MMDFEVCCGLFFFIIPIILLLGSWIFSSRIDDKIFKEKYLKETFDL
jgi:hypothetical protein